VSDRKMLASLLDAYRDGQQELMRGSPLPIQSAPCEVRREIFARMGGAAQANGIELSVCACKNAGLARGSCNIAGIWSRRQECAVQPLLI
jgi:hypothetical protein